MKLLRRSGVIGTIAINSLPAMKLISLLSAAALLGLGVFALDLSLSAYVTATSLLVVLGVVRDYSPRRARWEPVPGNSTPFPSTRGRPVDRLAA